MKHLIEAKHGRYIQNPKCQYCGKGISHEWLDGDYTFLICSKKKCLDTHKKEFLNETFNRSN